MILVTGATGTVGREVIAQLVTAGQPVRALTRDPSKARFDHRVVVAQGDLAKPDTLSAALAGVDRVFSVSTGPDIGAHERNLALAAKSAGVEHVVKLSVLGAGEGRDNAIITWHEAGERAMQESGLSWTFVRPGMFMSNGLHWAGSIRAQGKVFWPYGAGRVAPVHPRDIAAVAVAALTATGHEGKAYGLTGPEALHAAEMVAALSESIGKPIEAVILSEEAGRENMLKAGMPPVLVNALLRGVTFRPGRDQVVLPTVEQVLGRKALTWREWTREHAAAFA